jgi:hypothetical protein
MASPIEGVSWLVFIAWSLVSALLGAIIQPLGADIYNKSKNITKQFLREENYTDDGLKEATLDLIDDLETFADDLRRKSPDELLSQEEKNQFEKPLRDNSYARAMAKTNRTKLCEDKFQEKYYDRTAEIKKEFDIRGYEISDINRPLSSVERDKGSFSTASVRTLTSGLQELLEKLDREQAETRLKNR